MDRPKIPFLSSCSAPKVQFLQLTGDDGTGTRRLSFSFLPEKSKVIWISSAWKIYAPALWELAKEKEIFLMGLETPPSLSLRKLFYELYESQVFQAWVLDHLNLNPAEGFFLHKLLAHSNIQVIVLDAYPHSFCQKRLKIFLSHNQYRIQWTKGGPPHPQFIPARTLLDFQEDLCSQSD